MKKIRYKTGILHDRMIINKLIGVVFVEDDENGHYYYDYANKENKIEIKVHTRAEKVLITDKEEQEKFDKMHPNTIIRYRNKDKYYQLINQEKFNPEWETSKNIYVYYIDNEYC